MNVRRNESGIGITRRRSARVILAAGPEVAAHERGLAEGHGDTRGTEEGGGGAVIFAEVEVYVGTWGTEGWRVRFLDFFPLLYRSGWMREEKKKWEEGGREKGREGGKEGGKRWMG